MKPLYIFATSERPDAYVNTLAYAIAYLQITSIFVIVISEHDYDDDENKDGLLASAVVANISEQLHSLSVGKYVEWDKEANKKTIPLVNTANINLYKRCLEAMNRSGTTGIVIPLAKLDSALKQYISKSPCIIDVSALKKHLLVDVVATLLSIDFTEVYSFDLRQKPTYGQRDLYHNLKFDEDFLFRNLTESDCVAKSLGRIRRLSASQKSFMRFTAILAIIVIVLNLFWKDSTLLNSLNIAAIAASIGSFLFPLVRERM